jgi:hypothetical protein
MSRRGPRSLVALLLLLSLGATASGCSVAFTNGPPPPQERRAGFDCSGYGLPALDTALAVLGIGFFAIGGPNGTSESLDGRRGQVSAIAATAFAISAAIGYVNVYNCREALEEAAPEPELPHHHRMRLPSPAPAPAPAVEPPAPPVPQTSDPSDAP